MAIKSFEVKSYKVKAGFELSGGGGGPKSRGYLACFGDDGYRFVIYFAAPGSAMAPPRYFPNTKFGSINVPVDEMPHYVDLVRNEKPVYAYLNSDNPQWNSISTSTEPVGEEES
ncbi:MAG: hypothetical protein ACE5GX_20525 [Thermoanaerobaculia bacterium]